MKKKIIISLSILVIIIGAIIALVLLNSNDNKIDSKSKEIKETETVSKEDEKDSEESEETTEEKTEEESKTEESKTEETTTEETKSEQSNSNSSSNNTTKETTTTTEETQSEQTSENNNEDNLIELVDEAVLWRNHFMDNLSDPKGAYDKPLSYFIEATPEKYKSIINWQIATKYTYYKYTITDEADGSRTITKQGFMVDILRYMPSTIATIGDISEYGITDEYLQTAPAGTYETKRIAHTIVY